MKLAHITTHTVYNTFCEGPGRLTARIVTNISVESFKDVLKRVQAGHLQKREVLDVT